VLDRGRRTADATGVDGTEKQKTLLAALPDEGVKHRASRGIGDKGRRAVGAPRRTDAAIPRLISPADGGRALFVDGRRCLAL
jgi:hypothetical protein